MRYDNLLGSQFNANMKLNSLYHFYVRFNPFWTFGHTVLASFILGNWLQKRPPMCYLFWPSTWWSILEEVHCCRIEKICNKLATKKVITTLHFATCLLALAKVTEPLATFLQLVREKNVALINYIFLCSNMYS